MDEVDGGMKCWPALVAYPVQHPGSGWDGPGQGRGRWWVDSCDEAAGAFTFPVCLGNAPHITQPHG